MRGAHSLPKDNAMVDGDGTAARSSSSGPHQSNGFTAVNGESYTSSTHHPSDSGKGTAVVRIEDQGASRHPQPFHTSFHEHGWRPADRAIREPASLPAERDSSPTRKRKRSISLNVDSQGRGRDSPTESDGRDSPKHRVASTLDSAIDLTSPVTNMQSALSRHNDDFRVRISALERRLDDAAPIGPYVRERSPVGRWNQGEPPPKPRPEVAALLAEEVNKFHQTQQTEGGQQIRAAAEVEASSPTNGAMQQDPNACEDDEPHCDNDDPKKPRKRNFSNRTKTGCHTCRRRKKKCDERKPECGNCQRGDFVCEGYGQKPPNGSKTGGTSHLRVQPKAYDNPPPAGAYYHSPSDEPGLSYSHWGRVPTAELPPPEHGRHAPDQRYPPPSRESWHRPGWSVNHSTPSHFGDRFPPPDYPHAAQYHYSSAHTPLPPPQQHGPPPISDPFAPYGPMDSYHRSSNRPPTVASSHSGSGHTHSSQHTANLALTIAGFQPSEKDKMLRGQPFLHWLDNLLIGERDSCSIAVDCYNKGSRSDKGLSREAKQGLFAQILDPNKRIHGGQRAQQQTPGPTGTVKDHTIVESPFKCDYGYNIHLGSASVLQSGCYLQDAADITIGDKVIIGSDVKIHTLTAAVDCASRKGSQGQVVAGAVLIEDDVFIGANSTILPYCTIGRGAVVGAGSVVTRDVKENTVVAGNPAKFIRSIASTGEPQPDRRHAYEIQERNERVKKRMIEYANSGFNKYSMPPPKSCSN